MDVRQRPAGEVMEEFLASKTTEEYEFNKIPIWIRVFKLPLGMMDYDMAESIGNRVGEFLAVDGMLNGLVMGKYLRVQVRLLITKPPDERHDRHVDKGCSVKLKKGEEAPYGRGLKWMPQKRTGFTDQRKSWSDGSRGRHANWGNRGSDRGSDGPSWRRHDSLLQEGGRKDGAGERVVTKPLQLTRKEDSNMRSGVPENIEVEGQTKGENGDEDVLNTSKTPMQDVVLEVHGVGEKEKASVDILGLGVWLHRTVWFGFSVKY
ncbi:hypothetical protein ACQ4PT_022840 [Festuca glaucescens]